MFWNAQRLRQTAIPITESLLRDKTHLVRTKIKDALEERGRKERKALMDGKTFVRATSKDREFLGAKHLLDKGVCKTIEEVRERFGAISKATETELRRLGYH